MYLHVYTHMNVYFFNIRGHRSARTLLAKLCGAASCKLIPLRTAQEGSADKEPYYRRQRHLLSRQRALYVYKDLIFPQGFTAYCIWSVIYFQSPISIFLVSFQRNVWQKRPRELDSRFRCEIQEMSLQMCDRL